MRSDLDQGHDHLAVGQPLARSEAQELGALPPPPAVVPPRAADAAPVPEPTSGEIRVRYILALALPAVYVVLLAFFAAEWLAGGHGELRDVCLGGFTFLAGFTASDLGHFLGGQAITGAVNQGVGLTPLKRE